MVHDDCIKRKGTTTFIVSVGNDPTLPDSRLRIQLGHAQDIHDVTIAPLFLLICWWWPGEHDGFHPHGPQPTMLPGVVESMIAMKALKSNGTR